VGTDVHSSPVEDVRMGGEEGDRVNPQCLKRHEDVCDDQREIAVLWQEMLESEQRMLQDIFKCPRLCEFPISILY